MVLKQSTRLLKPTPELVSCSGLLSIRFKAILPTDVAAKLFEVMTHFTYVALVASSPSHLLQI
jgi:hypothetical protein